MIKCKKCDVYLDTVGSYCPLCGTSVEKNENSTYPHIKERLTSNLLRKVLIFNVLLISAIVILLNYTLTPGVNWSGFVIAGLVSMFIVFDGIMRGRKRVLPLMFYMCFIVIAITIFWDYYTGYRGWSVNYVFPSIMISYGLFLLVLRLVSYFAFREHSNFIYFNVLFEFVPLILYYQGIITFKPLSIISAIFGIINLLILVLFDFSVLKLDLEKKLHI